MMKKLGNKHYLFRPLLLLFQQFIIHLLPAVVTTGTDARNHPNDLKGFINVDKMTERIIFYVVMYFHPMLYNILSRPELNLDYSTYAMKQLLRQQNLPASIYLARAIRCLNRAKSLFIFDKFLQPYVFRYNSQVLMSRP